MRLHLPKTLLAAVLAACAALPTWGEDSGGAVDTPTTTYTVTVGDTTKTFNNLDIGSTLPTTTKEALWVNTSTGEKVTVTSGTQGQLNNARTIILGNGSYTTTTTGEDGNPSTSAPREVTASQLFLQGWNGNGGSTEKIDITSALIVGVNGGDLSSNGAKNAAVRFGADTNASYEVKISGDITVAADATFVAGGNNAVISGSIIGNGKTLTLGDFNSAAIYNLTGADEKSISLGGLTISGNTAVNLNYETATIGTLTLNSSSTSAALTLTGSGTTTITSLVTSGSVLDASEMTGTLTIRGAKWTGNLTVASVEVLKAKDAGTATILANSMNTTRGISYSFSATDTSVYRVLRTDSLTDLTAELQGNPGSRIVVNATYDGTTFTNVGLNELLAGDKVTINGLTGWIGDNSSNSISANLVFEGVNSINNGSSNGTINYSGAISGSGTLSFDWIATESDGSTTIKTNTYVFTGDLSGFAGTIKDDATLNVTIGGTLAEGVSNAVEATIDIAGILTVNRETTFTNGFTAKQLNGNQRIYIEGDQTITCTQDGNYSANIDVKSGKLTVAGFVKTRGELDMKKQGDYTGYVEVARGGVLTVGSSIWGMAATSKILLQEEGSLKWNGLTITGKAAKEGVDTGLKFGENSSLALNNSNHTVTNSTITYSRDDEKTLSWQLVDTDLNVESGTVNLVDKSIGGNLTINGGTVKTSADSNKGVVGAHTVTINAGGTLEAKGVDAFGWQDGQKCTQIVMGGTAEDALAQLKLNSGSSWQTTLGTDVLLKGYSSIGGNSAFKTAGGKIKATGTNNVISASMCVMDDVEVEVTGATDTLQIDEIKYFHNYDSNAESSGTVSVTGEGTLSVGTVTRSALKNTGSGSVEVTGAVSDSTISNTGSGSVTLSGTTDSATKLISSGSNGSLTAQGVSSLAEVKAENGGSVALIAAADTSVSVADLTIGTNGQAQAYTSEIALGTVIADKVNIGESGAKFQGNLNITGGLTVQVGSNGQTGGLNMAAAFVGTARGTLTLGSATGTGIELNLSYIPVMTTGDTLTLFSGVDSVLYYEIISAGTGEAEAAAVTLSDSTLTPLTGTAVDASKVFNNVDPGFFTVKFVDNNVILTASSNVPEPTTATLSLLALMGLAARRRRRKA